MVFADDECLWKVVVMADDVLSYLWWLLVGNGGWLWVTIVGCLIVVCGG